MTAIGETLRRERVRRNLELDAISRELKISSRFLEAIEDEQFDKLPGGVFAKSFVRQYARLLGLDDEELAGEMQRALEPSPGPQSAEQPRQSAPSDIHLPRVEEWESAPQGRFSWSSSLPALALVVVVMLVCSVVYTWWQRTRHPIPAHEVAAVPVETAQAPQPEAPMVQPAVPPAVVPPEAAPPPSAQTQPAAQSSADRPAADRVPPSRPDAPPGTAPAAVAARPAVESAPSANPNAQVRVEMVADEPVWVLARTDGKYLFSGTLEPNQTRTVEATGEVVLRLGNAGGVSITLNGKPIGAVGPKGQVRTVQFTSGGFQVVAPKPSLDDLL